LALGCDLVVAADNARFSEIFVRRGLSLDFGGSWVLPRRIGMHRAKELAFFGEIIGASDAFEMGLVNRVLPENEIDQFVDEWASRLAAGPPIALAQTKRLLNNSLNVTLEEALDSLFGGNAGVVDPEAPAPEDPVTGEGTSAALTKALADARKALSDRQAAYAANDLVAAANADIKLQEALQRAYELSQ
jgi:hypothetical protein